MADTGLGNSTGSAASGGSPSIGQDESLRSQIASRALDDAKRMGNELLGAACSSITAVVEEQRTRAAEQIAAVGDALRSSGEALDHDTGIPVGRFADEAATRLGDFAQTVRSRPWRQLAVDVEDFARAWPMAFVGAAIGIGFLAGRFLFSAAAAPAPKQSTPKPGQQYASGGQEPRGGAHHDYGAVSGAVSGNVRAGYGPSEIS